jgi:hypothetical protein
MEKICGVISVSFNWWTGNETEIPADPGSLSGIVLGHRHRVVPNRRRHCCKERCEMHMHLQSCYYTDSSIFLIIFYSSVI